MRNLIAIVESAMRVTESEPSCREVSATKAWLHPATGKIVKQGAMERHPEYVASFPEKFGLTPEQIPDSKFFPGEADFDEIEEMMQKAGWVRVSNFNDAELSMAQFKNAEDRGLICSALEKDARWAIRWLLKQDEDFIPDALDVEINGRLMRLNDPSEIAAFASRGVRPMR